MSKKYIAGLTLLLIAALLIVAWMFISTGLPVTDEARAGNTAQRYLNALCSRQFDPVPDLIWNGEKYPKQTILKSAEAYVLGNTLYGDCTRMEVDPGTTTELHYSSGQRPGVERTFSIGFWTSRTSLSDHYLPVVKTSDGRFLVVADFLDLAAYLSSDSTRSPVLNKSGQDIGEIETSPATVSHCVPIPGIACIRIPITLRVKDYVAWTGYGADLRIGNKSATGFDVGRLPDEVNRLDALPIRSDQRTTGTLSGYLWFEASQDNLTGDAALLFTAWNTDGDAPVHPSVVKITFQLPVDEKRWPQELDAFPQKAKYVDLSETRTADNKTFIHHKEIFTFLISTSGLRSSMTFPIYCAQFRLLLADKEMIRGSCTSIRDGDSLPADHDIQETLVFEYDTPSEPARLEYWAQTDQRITVKVLWP